MEFGECIRHSGPKGLDFLLTRAHEAEIRGGKGHGICQLSRCLRTCVLAGRGGRSQECVSPRPSSSMHTVRKASALPLS